MRLQRKRINLFQINSFFAREQNIQNITDILAKPICLRSESPADCSGVWHDYSAVSKGPREMRGQEVTQ